MKQLLTSMNMDAKLPAISIGLAVFSLLLYFADDASVLLQYDRSAIADGQVWRLVTGHFTHWSFDHFLWCTVTFLALGTVCETFERKGYIVSLAASIIFIPVVCWLFDPGMILYRGLSGTCSTVFIVGAIQIVMKGAREKDLLNVILPLAGCLLFLGKILYEYTTGQALFVETSSLFSPVPLAHLVGCCLGIFIAVYLFFKRPQPVIQNKSQVTC